MAAKEIDIIPVMEQRIVQGDQDFCQLPLLKMYKPFGALNFIQMAICMLSGLIQKHSEFVLTQSSPTLGNYYQVKYRCIYNFL